MTEKVSLNGTWLLSYCEPGEGEAAGWAEKGLPESSALEAVVPGEAHLDLVRAGVIPEPLYGTNAEKCRWMEEKDWWYCRAFAAPEGLEGKRAELCFHGLDTHADIWLNGQHLGATRNAFISHTFDVSSVLRPGENLLVLRLDTGLRWARTQELAKYAWPDDSTMPERIWLRRAQFTGGWDWAPRLLTVGIWRPVELLLHAQAIIRDVFFQTHLGPAGEAVIDLTAEVESLAPENTDVRLSIQLGEPPCVHSVRGATLAPGPNLLRHRFTLAEPRLWWPRGLGEQYLYPVRCSLWRDGEELCEWRGRLGIRQLQLLEEELGPGEGRGFCFAVNGREFFAKGADWVPADSIPARVTQDKYRRLLQEAAQAGFNMLRIWGGGIYEDEAFYEACDELGILIWQDFMFACSAIPDDDPQFRQLVEQEARQVIRRLRNHPSLALWCGNNENQWLAQRAAPQTLEYGRYTYHELLPRLCQELDPTRPYWPSSPWGGVDPNSELAGDRHAWDIALNPDNSVRARFRDYDRDRAKFVSEFGFLAPPVLASLREFIPAEELFLGSPTWQFHENTFDNGVLRHVVTAVFGARLEELQLDEFVFLSQAFQAEAYHHCLRHWISLWPLCSGALFWMFSDCWGATSGWTIVDYYLRRKPSFYAVRRAFSALLPVIARQGKNLSVSIVNTGTSSVRGKVQFGRGALDGSEFEVIASGRVEVPAQWKASVTNVVLPPISEALRQQRYYWVRFEPHGRAQAVQDVFFQAENWSAISLADVAPNQKLEQVEENEYRLRLWADRLIWGVWIEHSDAVSVSDNYLTLIPGVTYEVTLVGPQEDVEAITIISVNEILNRTRAAAR